MIIDLTRFLTAERPSWAELEEFLTRLEKDPRLQLTVAEVQRFHYLYQKVSADLARITTFASEPEVRRYLESLIARAYGEIHGTRGGGGRFPLVSWFYPGFPLIFRKRRMAFLLSLVVTLAGAAFGGMAVNFDPEAKQALIPSQFEHLTEHPSERVRREESADGERSRGGEGTFASQLMTHNIRVSIVAMALGVTWGIGTIMVLFHNGVLLGMVILDYIRAGESVFLLGWLMPHGVIEIPAVLIAGQAGFVIGAALFGKGSRLPLSTRLRSAGRDAVVLLGGVAVMLVWAGLVESFLSQRHQPSIPYVAKIAFGTLELVLLVWFLGSAGRNHEAARQTEAAE